jgi:hypothetical protein
MRGKGDTHIFAKVVLCDVSSIVALRRAGLLEAALECGLSLAISDLVREREMCADEVSPEGLRVEELLPASLERAFLLHRLYPRLALTDASTQALAVQRSWPILTQCLALSRLALEMGVQLRSIEWLRDELRQRRCHLQVREKGTVPFSAGVAFGGGDEFGDRDFQLGRKLGQYQQGGVALAAFEQAHVVAMQAGTARELFLRKATAQPRRAQFLSECVQKPFCHAAKRRA